MPDTINNEDFKNQLYAFIKEAGEKTYAGDGKPVETPERPNFTEYVYDDITKGFSYRDSYAGDKRSRGMEVVRKDGKPIWISQYGGGMVEGFEDQATDTFTFLKKAMSSKDKDTHIKNSFRGPHELKDGDWEYKYEQTGDVTEFSGQERIMHKGKLVFYHNVIGGMVVE